MPALDDSLSEELQTLHTQHRWRVLVATERDGGPYIRRDGVRYVSFSDNDYFGLSQHPAVIEAARHMLDVAGAGASQMVTGHHPALVALAESLADWKGAQAALIFGSGYLANIGTIAALCHKPDLILADKLIHACMLDGAALSGATLKRFRHNDVAHLELLLARHRSAHRRCLILVETVYSMDGDRASLEAIAATASIHDAWVMSDDAHGLGMIASYPVDIQMGTLSKGLGAYGGYVCGSRTLIDYLVNHARAAIFTTALPPSICAGANKAMDILRHDLVLQTVPLEHAQYFTQLLGLPSAQSAIVPLILGEDARALAASKQLAEDGIWVSAIRPPTVPVGTARLRFAFSALHTREMIESLAERIQSYGWL